MARRKATPPFVQESEPSAEELFVRGIARKMELARDDLEEFYRLVIKRENTHESLEPAAHQKVMFSFLQHHPHCVFRQPISTGKTFTMAAVTLWLMGRDVTTRGAFVSKVRKQASKTLQMVKDYIEISPLKERTQGVFPGLAKCPRGGSWTQYELTVDRPPGIRDPSLTAVGLGMGIEGARWSWFVGDDIIDAENTLTAASRETVVQLFEGRFVSRLDPFNSRAVVTNTPWQRDDLTYYLECQAGWPTITMDIYGFIRVSNADAAWIAKAEGTLLRPSKKRSGYYRLIEHDPDDAEETPLWPERWPLHLIEKKRRSEQPHSFARLMLCEPFDEEAARCQRDWVERCKLRGMGLGLVPEYTGTNPTYTGVDLAIGQGEEHDRTVFFTFERQDDGSRRILDIEGGRWDGGTIIDKLIDKVDRYGSSVAVETNTGQDFLRQWATKRRKDIVIKAHTTGRTNKHDLDFGVESVFGEIQQEAWIIPCDEFGKCHPEVQQWIEDMIYYQPPPAHTGDALMACWIARERARSRRSKRDPRRSKRPRKFSMVLHPGGF